MYAIARTALAVLVEDARLEERVVGVTPDPTFCTVERPEDRVPRLLVVLRHVTVLRRVATADVPADEAHAQHGPDVARFDTLRAHVGRRLGDRNLVQVGARTVACFP